MIKQIHFCEKGILEVYNGFPNTLEVSSSKNCNGCVLRNSLTNQISFSESTFSNKYGWYLVIEPKKNIR